MENCEQASINMRMNILHFLDALCESDQTVSSDGYRWHLRRDLRRLVGFAVPETREGLMNYLSTKQVLESWKIKRIVEVYDYDQALQVLQWRIDSIAQKAPLSSDAKVENLSRNEVIRRVEEDRERHKRLRERRWVLPAPPLSSQLRLNNVLPCSVGGADSAVDIEFENAWETTSDWNEDDDDAIDEENTLCFPGIDFGRRSARPMYSERR